MAPQIDHPAALQPWEAAPLTPVAPASGSYSRRRHLLSKVNKPTALALTPSMPPRALSVAIGADVVAKQLEVPLDQRFALRLSRNWFAIDDAIAGLKNDHEGFGTLGIGHYSRSEATLRHKNFWRQCLNRSCLRLFRWRHNLVDLSCASVTPSS